MQVIAVTGDLLWFGSALGSYSVPPLNSTQNYVPPQQDSTSDLTCDCDTVMYRCVNVHASRHIDRLTNGNGFTRI